MVRRCLIPTVVGIVVAILTYCYLFSQGITCPIKHFTGVSCPGCGMTRAMISALQLDFHKAFYYHPLWFTVVPFALLTALFALKKRKKSLICLFVVFLIIFLSVYLIRMFCGSDIVSI